MSKKLVSSGALASIVGAVTAGYIRFVRATSSFQDDPPGFIQKNLSDTPLLIAMWHGQGLLLPLLRPRGDIKVAVMVARHIDGDIVHETLKRFGMTTVRGAGAGRKGKDKGGFEALRTCLKAIRDNTSVALTADIPPGPARKAGLGLPTLAKLSGRAILPCAVVTRHYLKLNTWSGFTINLPFSRMVMTGGEQIRVPRHASDEEMEQIRQKLEDSMNEVTARAYRLTGTRERAIPNDNDPVAFGPVLRNYVRVTSMLQPLATTLLKHRERQGKEDGTRLGERLGVPSAARIRGPLVWLHAASVGETIAVLDLMNLLLDAHKDLSIVLTTGTVTSARLAATRLPKKRAMHQYVPLDAPGFMARFFDHWKPDAVILTESEIWPNLIREARLRKVPLLLVNGRISPRSFRRWRKRVKLARQLFGKLDLVLAQNDRYAGYFERLGSRNVLAVGNLKTDASPLPVDKVALSQLKKSLGKRPVFLAASTHRGEDEIVAQAHEKLKKDFPGLVTVIVPRHPERGPDIAAMLRSQGTTCALRSRNEMPGKTDIYIADTIGELGLFYSLCPVTFIGGSLVPHGGQNPIEAISLGSLVITGPNVHNFDEAYEDLRKSKACVEVGSAEALAEAAATYMRDDDARGRMNTRARETVAQMQGALQQTVDALKQYLPG